METWSLPTLHAPEVFLLSNCTSEKDRRALVKKVVSHEGVLIVSYDSLRIEKNIICRYNWFYTVLDEGQKIKNHKSLLYQAVLEVKSQNRLVLTGTPMQNNLTELWSLFSYVEPGLLGDLDFFTKNFCQVIIKGGYQGASFFEQEASK